MTLMVDDDGGSRAAQPRRVGRSRGADDGPRCGATKLREPWGSDSSSHRLNKPCEYQQMMTARRYRTQQVAWIESGSSGLPGH
jgi:hypothetical protein